MSAANASASSPSLQEEMRAHEPSMEEILASIRRIIADDELAPPTGRERRFEDTEALRPGLRDAYPEPALAPAPAEPVEAAPRAAPAPVTEIRRLRVNRASPESPAAAPPAPAPASLTPEPVASAPAKATAPVVEKAVEAAYAVAAAEPAREEALLSAGAASSIASHFEALTTSLFINDSGLLEKYAQEMLRPMLKEWLDDNLPVIVERLVRAEIERVARGGRR
jgi:cell pole-organizing protein PopZ